MSRAATVQVALELQLVVPGGPSLPVLADLGFAADDPWAVRLAFQTGGLRDDGIVEWIFARELLTRGIDSTVGEGDVRVWPASRGYERIIKLAMCSPSGSALFEIKRDSLVDFLQQTYFVVPTGDEAAAVDFDAELALLLQD